MAGDADGTSLWAELCQATSRAKSGARASAAETTRQKCVLLAAAILCSGDRDAKLAVLDETRGVVPLVFSTLHEIRANRAAACLLSALAVHGLRSATAGPSEDATLRRACLRVLASQEGLACLRAFAARPATRADAVALFELIVLDERWIQAARESFFTTKNEHVHALRALDPAGDQRQLDLLLAALQAAPMLLPRWLATSARSALSSPRPWDFKADGSDAGNPSERSLAGCAAFRAVLRVPGKETRVMQFMSLESVSWSTILAACLPPEDVLSKKELTRGILHANDRVKSAALELLLDILDRYTAEVNGVIDKDTWEDSEEIIDRLVAAANRWLTPEGTTKEDDRLVKRLFPSVQTKTLRHLKAVKHTTRDALQGRLPDVQTLLSVVNVAGQPENVISLAIAALRRYCSALPRAIADAKWDVLKAAANAAVTVKQDNDDSVDDSSSRSRLLLGQLAGLARIHPVDQTQRLRRPVAADKTAIKAQPIFLSVLHRSPPVRALLDETLAPITNSPLERRNWLDLVSSSPGAANQLTAAFFQLLARADQLKTLPAIAFDVQQGRVNVEEAVHNTEHFLQQLKEEDEVAETEREGLVSPLVCASLVLQEDRELAPLVPRTIVDLAHVTGAGHIQHIRALCQVVIALSPMKATLRSFARDMESDLSGIIDKDVEMKPASVEDDDMPPVGISVQEGNASKEQLTSGLSTRVGMPLLTPFSRQTVVRKAIEQDPESFPRLREALACLPFPLLIAHLCAPFGTRGNCVAGTTWGATLMHAALNIVMSRASKEACMDACRAAAVGLARCCGRRDDCARRLMRDTQHELVEYLLSRKQSLIGIIDSSLYYEADNSRTPLAVLSRAQASEAGLKDAPRAMVMAEKAMGLAKPCYELACFVSPSVATTALTTAAVQGKVQAVVEILGHSFVAHGRESIVLATRELIDLWLRHAEAPAVVDEAVAPTLKLSMLALLHEPLAAFGEDQIGARLTEACWRAACSADSAPSRQRAAQKIAVSIIAVNSSSRERLHQIILDANADEKIQLLAARFYSAIRPLQRHTSSRERSSQLIRRYACSCRHFLGESPGGTLARGVGKACIGRD